MKRIQFYKSFLNRISADNMISLTIAFTAMFSVLSCARFIPARPAPSEDQPNSNVASNSNANSKSSDDFRALLDKKTEFRTMSPPIAIDPNAKITGKAIVASSESKLDDNTFFSYARQAKSLDELQNIIQINCKRGKYVGDYAWNGSGSKTKGYASDCKVSLIDYKANKVIAQKSFSNAVADDIVLAGNSDGDGILMDKPFRDIIDYVHAFQYDRLIQFNSVDGMELVKTAATEKLDPNSGLRGKVAVATQIERGPYSIGNYASTSFISAEKYGLPPEKVTAAYNELETFVRIICKKGSPIGTNQGATQFASKCEVSVIDFKSMTTVARKTIENKVIAPNITKDVSRQWVVDPPTELITEYLRSLPMQ
jgi:hypothetical protein